MTSLDRLLMVRDRDSADRDTTASRFCTLHCRISRSSITAGILLSTEPTFTLTPQTWLAQLKTNVKVGFSFNKHSHDWLFGASFAWALSERFRLSGNATTRSGRSHALRQMTSDFSDLTSADRARPSLSPCRPAHLSPLRMRSSCRVQPVTCQCSAPWFNRPAPGAVSRCRGRLFLPTRWGVIGTQKHVFRHMAFQNSLLILVRDNYLKIEIGRITAHGK